ncbi:class I ribonucleotide reductase maintenance protein YfaE [Alteromonas sp. BMJM2]|uniref:class I ribonucleotide reductase maintenance protein YfaE n=1 Tax=Alteromonas sp. BMJM2 TaxID=2954241 RepID=UPI0022B36C17|nr:class I ribonucleotide reductase maintenance protein YfaE [Alteromonas sp. BMJM2]
MNSSNEMLRIDIVDVGQINAPADKTLLSAIEAAGINIHYHCREGFCGACRTKLLEGEVEYTTDPLAFIDDDEILPCCCVAKQPLKIKVPL